NLGPLALTECTIVDNFEAYGADDVINIASRDTAAIYDSYGVAPLLFPADGRAASATINGCIIGKLIGDPVDPASAHNLIPYGWAGRGDGVNGNQIGYAPGLAALADRGEGRQTCAVLRGSGAIGMGITHPPADTDERGWARPVGTPSDIGAF